jgi:hypothetical protein
MNNIKEQLAKEYQIHVQEAAKRLYPKDLDTPNTNTKGCESLSIDALTVKEVLRRYRNSCLEDGQKLDDKAQSLDVFLKMLPTELTEEQGLAIQRLVIRHL